MAGFSDCRLVVVLPAVALLVWAQAGPPGPPGPHHPVPKGAERIQEVQRKLNGSKAVNITAQRALEFSRIFLARAGKALEQHENFRADRMGEAADSLLHVAEHQEHLQTGGGPKELPPAAAIQDHLQRAYFKTQQADLFYQQCQNEQVVAFPKWSRDFYQLAVQAYERKDFMAADENCKSAEDIVKALENLAQAASPAILPKPSAKRANPE